MDADNFEPAATVTNLKYEDIAVDKHDDINDAAIQLGGIQVMPGTLSMIDASHLMLQAKLEVTPETFAELKYRLEQAGWDEQIRDDGTLDLSGIIITKNELYILSDDDGHHLAITDAQIADLLQDAPKAAEIPAGFIVNGKEMSMPNGAVQMTYEVIRDYAGMKGSPSMTYSMSPASQQQRTSGILAPGEAITVEPGTVFNVCHTGNA